MPLLQGAQVAVVGKNVTGADQTLDAVVQVPLRRAVQGLTAASRLGPLRAAAAPGPAHARSAPGASATSMPAHDR